MTELNETRDVRCPYHLARRYLAESLSHVPGLGNRRTLTLEMPLVGLALRKEVTATFAEGADPMHFDQPWRIRWTPQGGGPYPDFDGELTVRSGEDYTDAMIELHGFYKPPGGAAGSAFDAVAGSRIAAATARQLLGEIAQQMESRYQKDEEEKRTSV